MTREGAPRRKSGNISLDGVHPSAQGQTIVSNAAVQAINARYGPLIP
jgi:hypothetical protein